MQQANAFNQPSHTNQRPEADAFVNRLSIIPAGKSVEDAIPLGLSKVVAPLVGEDNALHAKLFEAAQATEDGYIDVVLTARIQVNAKKHGAKNQPDLKDVSFAL